MRRKVRKIMAFLLAFALVMSAAGSGKLTVLAETSAQEITAETQSQPASQSTETTASDQNNETPGEPVSEEQPAESEGQTGNDGGGENNGSGESDGQEPSSAGDGSTESSSTPTESVTTPTESTAAPTESPAVPTETGTESTSEAPTETASETEETTETATEEITEEETETLTEETTEMETETLTEETTEMETETLTEEETEAETLEYTPESQPEGISVWAYAKEGTFPEGTKMLVSRLDGNAKDEAGAALDDSGVEYDGFFALDISFEDADGNALEPEEGSVEVRFEVDASFLPEEADADSLEVQHLDESGDGTNVETVATASDGSVSVSSDKVKAAFAVESFSTFTITYQYGDWFWESANLKVNCIDENGEGVGNWRYKVSEITGVTPVREVAPSITNYSFARAVVATSAENAIDAEAEEIKRIRYRGDNKESWQYSISDSENDWDNVKEGLNVYFIYTKEPVKLTGTVQARIYLRYDNAIPYPMNQSQPVGNFGPASNNRPYLTVTVDLSKIDAEVSGTTDGKYYYSIENEKDWSNSTYEERRTAAEDYWKKLYAAIDSDGQRQLDELFGGYYIGYVLKMEKDDPIEGRDDYYWHIDGILQYDPPIYVVEVYEGNTVQFVCASGGSGVTYDSFKEELESFLGGEEYQYSQETDRVVVNYKKEGVTYKTTVTPYQNDDDSEYYHIYPDNEGNGFGYATKIADRYYLCRLIIETEKVTGDIVITKKVVDPLGTGVDSEFGFTLSSSDISSGSYDAVVTKTDSDSESRAVVFSGGEARIFLKDGETIRISGLPYDSIITITEDKDANKYSTVITDESAAATNSTNSIEVTVGDNEKVITFTNTMNIPVPTGLHTDNRPWIGMIAVATAGLCGCLISWRRRKRIR